MPAVTRDTLSQVLQHRVGLSRLESADLIDQVLDGIIDGLSEDGLVKMTGFGVWKVHVKRERLGRNPKTGQPAVVSARKSVGFAPAQRLRETVNAGAAPVSGKVSTSASVTSSVYLEHPSEP